MRCYGGYEYVLSQLGPLRARPGVLTHVRSTPRLVGMAAPAPLPTVRRRRGPAPSAHRTRSSRILPLGSAAEAAAGSVPCGDGNEAEIRAESAPVVTAWPTPAPLGGPSVDVVGFGEPLVLLQPRNGEALASAQVLDVHVAGAELNACAAVASLGGSATLVTRLGDDPLAAQVRTHVSRLGVGLEAETDRHRPTGVFFKDIRPDGARRVHYYRSGSAAAAMAPADADRGLRLRPRAVVVSGLTAAIGHGPRDMIRHVGEQAADHGAALVIDVNLRPQLGHVDEVLSVLRDLLPRTTLLVVGTDEAMSLFGTDKPEQIVRAALETGCREVVVKAGAQGCWWVDAAGSIRHTPSRAVTVVDPVGAGDAFTGGFLAARLAGADREAAANLASDLAARVVSTSGDTTGLPDQTTGRRLLASLIGSSAPAR